MENNTIKISNDKKTAMIRLKGLDQIREVAAAAVEHDYVIILQSGNYSVNGKSVMGILSLDLSSPVVLAVDKPYADEFFAEVSKFIVDGE